MFAVHLVSKRDFSRWVFSFDLAGQQSQELLSFLEEKKN